MKISKYLSYEEIIYSQTAIKHGIDNEPSERQIAAFKEVAKVFDEVREYIGAPLAVTSGFRSKELNARIGGAISSDHMSPNGNTAALDIDAHVYSNGTNADIFHYIKDNCNFKQLIWEFGTDEEPAWVHIGVSRWLADNKNEVLVAKRVNGRTTYEYYQEKE